MQSLQFPLYIQQFIALKQIQAILIIFSYLHLKMVTGSVWTSFFLSFNAYVSPLTFHPRKSQKLWQLIPNCRALCFLSYHRSWLQWQLVSCCQFLCCLVYTVTAYLLLSFSGFCYHDYSDIVACCHSLCCVVYYSSLLALTFYLFNLIPWTAAIKFSGHYGAEQKQGRIHGTRCA